MRGAGVGRVLVASLHQSIADILPTRLGFYENWLNPAGLREGTIVDVERTEIQRRARHIAVIRYEIPLPAAAAVEASESDRFVTFSWRRSEGDGPHD